MFLSPVLLSCKSTADHWNSGLAVLTNSLDTKSCWASNLALSLISENAFKEKSVFHITGYISEDGFYVNKV